MKKYTKSIVLVVLAAIFLAGCDANCSGLSSSKSNVTTINGNTQGFEEKNTKNKGSAKFNVEGSRVDMTNFSFNADESGKIQATIEDEDLVFARVIVYDGNDDVWQNITDGHYKEPFNEENLTAQLNDLYQKTMQATDAPISKDHITVQGNMSYVPMSISNGSMLMIVKNGTDQFINIAYTTLGHNTEDILERAMGTFGGNAAPSNNVQESSSKNDDASEPATEDMTQEENMPTPTPMPEEAYE